MSLSERDQIQNQLDKDFKLKQNLPDKSDGFVRDTKKKKKKKSKLIQVRQIIMENDRESDGVSNLVRSLISHTNGKSENESQSLS